MSESATLAIIGISCLFPKAGDLQAYWNNIKNGVDAITSIPEGSHWNIEDYYDPDPKAADRTYARRGGFLSPVDFNPMEFGISPKDIEATDTTQLLGMLAAKQALVDSGYDTKPFDRTKTSVILGVTGALELVIPLGARLGHPIWRRALREAGINGPLAEDVVQRIADSYVGWQENSFPGLLGNVTAGRIASRLDLGGTNCVVDAACASSMAALHQACLELSSGQADMVITGGVDTFNDIFMFMCFSKTPALSPTGDAKPFDSKCDGTIIGEGVGMLVIKRLADAERDGDRIYAVIKGVGSSSDGRGNAIYAPRAEGQRVALKRAYETSQVTPDTIDLVEAHGTGTKVGDATEIKSLTEVYRSAQTIGTWAALGSVKSQIGHTKAAAGVAGIIKAALSLRDKILPPTIKVNQPVEELAPGKSPFYVNTRKRPWLPRPNHARRAAVSAFGFGGTNFHCVLEEHGATRTEIGWDGDTEIFAFANDRLEDLRAAVNALPVQASWNEVRSTARQSRASFRLEAKHRLLIPLQKGASVTAARDEVLKMLASHPDQTSWSLPSGAAFGTGEPRGKLGVLFPGQGSQYPGMLNDLACQFPAMLETLAEADRVFAREHPEAGAQRLSDYIFPHPAFNDADKARQEEALKSTDVAQPAIGAVSLGALNVLSGFGVKPDAVAGHSFGELPALCAAGRLNPEALHRLANVRGRLMANCGAQGNAGAMLAVQAEESVVTRFIKEECPGLVIANHNSPRQFVLAGPRPEIEAAAATLAQRGLRARVLPVAAAFHSPLVAAARPPFAEALEETPFHRGQLPVYANASARAYPAGSKPARELLARQIVEPVNFIALIEAMRQDGVTTFVEAGPGHVLSDLVQAILAGQPVATVPLDSSRGKRSGIFDLAVALCRLAALGHSVELNSWEDRRDSVAAKPTGKPGMVVPIGGANYRKHHPTGTPRPPIAAALKPSIASVMSSPESNPPGAPATPPRTPAAPMMPAGKVSAAWQMAQQGMLALQKLQEQTAQLHRQFLETQEAARRTMEALLLQRRELLGLPASAALPAMPAPVTPAMPDALPAMPVAFTPVFAPAPPAPVAPVVPAPAPKPAPAPTAPNHAVADAVLAVVADKTGYPPEMLNLEMGLDSDLGIDSIKRVEIMAALRSRLPGAPEVKPEHLGTLQTLREVVAFLSGGSAASTPTPAPVAAPVVADTSPIKQVLLEVVAEKTGYPAEMLNLEMGLDSDLGIDSIKRVEIMAAIRSRLPQSPEIKPEHLGTLQTLGQIVEFLGGSAPESPATPAVAPVAANTNMAATATQALLAVVADKTGYPVEMLNLDMGLDSDLGIDSIKRVEIMAALRTQLPGAPEIKPEHLGALQTLRQVVDFLVSTPASTSAVQPAVAQPAAASAPVSPVTSAPEEELHRQIVRPMPLGDASSRDAIKLKTGALIWVADDGAGLGAEVEKLLVAREFKVRRSPAEQLLSEKTTPAGLLILWPAKGATDSTVATALRLMQVAAPSLRQSNGLLASVSSLDGQFGFGSGNLGDPLSGGLAGLVKTARHEWPEVHCKAIDLAPGTKPAIAASRIVEEFFLAGPIEAGITESQCYRLQVEPAPIPSPALQSVLKPGDLVVVTGGARGVTAAAVLELAKEFRPTLALLGRTRVEESEPAWLSSLTAEGEIKKALLSHLPKNTNGAAGNGASGSPSPKQIEAAYRDVLAQREIRGHLAQFRAAGAQAVYVAVDARRPEAMAEAIAKLRAQHGPVRGVIHGAGVLADRRIEDKTTEQFDLVYGTKVDGLRNLLAAVGSDDLKVLALFSSYTGRFGRTGQVDYAAANEVLNKLAQAEARRRPQCRVVSFNWGPWNGGMVNDSLRKVFAAEGIGLIETDAGARLFARDIAAPAGGEVEVLVLAHLPKTAEAAGLAAPPMLNVAFEREVSVTSMPCLESHVLNGHPVLPTALMIEWLAHGAMHGNPGLQFHGFDDFKVLKGLVLESGKPARISLLAGDAKPVPEGLRVPVQLVSQPAGRQILHARADVILADALPAAPTASAPNNRAGTGTCTAYGDGRLFHGPHFHAIETVESCAIHEIAALVGAAPAPKQWLRDPLRPGWLADPLMLDASFQMLILWSWQHRQAGALPCAIQSYRQFAAYPKAGGRVLARITSGDTPIIAANIEFQDRQGHLLAVAKGCESVVDAALREAFQRNRL